MTTTKTDKWFLSLEEAVLEPLSWMELEERVRAASAERASLVITGLLLTATLHGLYDAALYEQARSPWLAMGVAVLTLLLFVVYSRSGEKILERVVAEHPAPASGGAAVAAS